MKRSIFMWTCITTCFVFLFGCHIPSTTAMYGQGGRTSYNISAQHTTNQELLLNLVRLRYSDVPYFLELKGITTQFSFAGKINSSVKLLKINKNNPVSLGGECMWSNQPTIQYSPLEGRGFISQLMNPLDLRIIQSLILAGWDVDRVFRMLVHNMITLPNACSASGPIPISPPSYAQFFEVMKLMRYFQVNGTLQVGIRYMASDNYDLNEKENFQEAPNTIQISFPAEGERADRLAELLQNVKKTKGRYVLTMRQAFNERAEIGIMMRSLLSSMHYLSLGVQVPPSDIVAQTVALTKHPDGTLFNWNEVVGDLIKIHWSFDCPSNAYLSIPYRGYWFYIDDSDVNSKYTFMLLQQIFNLQSKQKEKEQPILTIPIGSNIDNKALY